MIFLVRAGKDNPPSLKRWPDTRPSFFRGPLLCCLVLMSVLCAPSRAQTNAQSNAPATTAVQPVPALDGGAGPCSAELTVTADGKPVSAAKVNVHIAYGFGGFHKLDLEASTNLDGKVKFTGLPSRVRRSQLDFEAKKDELAGTVTIDPTRECRAIREIKLEKAKAAK